MYDFIADTPIVYRFDDVPIKVYPTKPIYHIPGEIHRRYIRRDKRIEIGNLLQIEKLSCLKSRILAEVPEDVLGAGNRNKALSLTVMQKIASDYNLRNDFDKDLNVFLMKLMEDFEQKWPGKVCPGYIQFHAMQLFMLVLLTEKILRYVLTLDQVLCHLDSTG